MRIAIDPERREEADVTLLARFADVRRKEGKPLWQARIEAKLAKVKGRWKVKSSRYETVDGRRPF